MAENVACKLEKLIPYASYDRTLFYGDFYKFFRIAHEKDISFCIVARTFAYSLKIRRLIDATLCIEPWYGN